MDSHACKVIATIVRILQLSHVEDAVLLGTYEERIVTVFPSVIANTVIQTVAEQPSSFLHVKVNRQSGKG